LDFEQFSFDPRIRAGIKAAGYITPTPIQQQAIPAVLKGHDVMGVAQTGKDTIRPQAKKGSRWPGTECNRCPRR
jgi:hypothetical protein